MTMQCIKTGCQAYLEPYGEYVYGDAHLVAGTLVLRICLRSHAGPVDSMLHFTVRHVDGWFDKDNSKVPDSTLLAANFTNHGYSGKPI